MDEHIKSIAEMLFDIDEITEYIFHEICGLTFVFKSEMLLMKSRISSASIIPVGIIYEENGEYYLAPLYDTINIDEIIKSYVESCLSH